MVTLTLLIVSNADWYLTWIIHIHIQTTRCLSGTVSVGMGLLETTTCWRQVVACCLLNLICLTQTVLICLISLQHFLFYLIAHENDRHNLPDEDHLYAIKHIVPRVRQIRETLYQYISKTDVKQLVTWKSHMDIRRSHKTLAQDNS